jgi:hypothetical protein
VTSGDATGIGTAQTAGNKAGTSMAPPQVAGLAAHLWRLEPSLTVADLRALLLATARPAMGIDTVFTCPTGVAGQPVVGLDELTRDGVGAEDLWSRKGGGPLRQRERGGLDRGQLERARAHARRGSLLVCHTR